MWASRDDELPSLPWEWTNKAEKVVSDLRKLGTDKSVDRILVATDPDREGEFIAWRLAEVLADLAPIHRVRFNEITRVAIKAAIDECGAVDDNLVPAAKGR